MKILVDTRERKPYQFENSEQVALETGDYTCESVNTAIERKSKPDFLKSITQDRERFEEECRRAKEFNKPMVILVEAPREDFEEGNYKSEAHPNSVIGTIESWSERYNIEFIFEKNRETAKKRAKSLLKSWSDETNFEF